MNPIYEEKTRDAQTLRAAGLAVLDAGMTEQADDKGKRFTPTKLFALFSGGHDSLTTTYLTSLHPTFSGVIHIDTGTGIPETQEFVRETCREYGWPLHVLKNNTTTYLMLVARYGFPGATPSAHSMMYRYLKERPLERFLPTQKTAKGDRIALAAGVRTQESAKRMGYVEPVRFYRGATWISPIHDWSALEVSRFVSAEHLRRNPVKDDLHISGECLCGCFADDHQREEIALWYPHVDKQLSAYEAVVRATAEHRLGGVEIEPKMCVWGWGAAEKRQETDENQIPLPLCHYCHAGRESLEIIAESVA